MSDSIPTQHTAGDTFVATLSGATYPASAGWVAQLVLIGPQRVVLSSTASGADHVSTATAATTAAWGPGQYQLRAIFTKGTERASAAAGSLLVLPDPAASGTDAASLLSSAQRALADLEVAYRAYLADGRVMLAEYTIAGRTMKYRAIGDLLAALQAARQDVQREQATARIAAGLSPRITFVTRM